MNITKQKHNKAETYQSRNITEHKHNKTHHYRNINTPHINITNICMAQQKYNKT